MATIMLMLYPSKTVQSSRHSKDVYRTEMINDKTQQHEAGCWPDMNIKLYLNNTETQP